MGIEVDLEERASRLLKGCKFHFHQSVTRIRRNGNYVSSASIKRFMQLIDEITRTEKFEELLALSKNILDEFPKCYTWLSWWMRCDTAGMFATFPGH